MSVVQSAGMRRPFRPVGAGRSLPGGLVVSKLADTTTTAVGLQFVPLVVESNPHLRLLMAWVGSLPGLLLGTVAVLGLVVLVTELAVLACGRLDGDARWAPPTVRFVGYVPLTIVFWAASVNNLVVIAAGLAGGG